MRHMFDVHGVFRDAGAMDALFVDSPRAWVATGFAPTLLEPALNRSAAGNDAPAGNHEVMRPIGHRWGSAVAWLADIGLYCAVDPVMVSLSNPQ